MRSFFEQHPATQDIGEVCQRLGIGRSAAYSVCRDIEHRLSRSLHQDSARQATECLPCRAKDFEIECLRYEIDHPGCRGSGDKRLQFEPGYKECVEQARARYGVTIARAAEILAVPVDTLKKFSRTASGAPSNEETLSAPLPPPVVTAVNEYLRYSGKGVKSVKKFWSRHPELMAEIGMNYRQLLGWLRKLGFVSPRGIFLKNSGLDKILRFRPNQVWCTDGKRLVIVLNGEIFPSVWQCLVDGKTTVIVGGVIRDEENTQNLLTALKESWEKTGIKPMAIVLDNRLSENMPAIRTFLDEHGIEMIKIFPGNSKSNGIAEENFNVYDRWVGAVEIKGSTPDALARSIQAAFVEVFTQMRGHKPRRALSFKTAREAMNETPPASPEEEADTRAKLKALADRLKNEQAQPEVSEQKKVAIAQAVSVTSPPQPEVFAGRLENPRFTPDLILQSIAVLRNARQAHPEKKFGHAYYGGILRNLTDQESIESLRTHLGAVYVQHWSTLGRLSREDLTQSLKVQPEATCTRLSTDFMNMMVPAYATQILLDLKQAFLVASHGCATIAEKIRGLIADHVIRSKRAPTERREHLLRKVYEWESFIRMCDADTPWPQAHAPAGYA
jgi:transposase InsO family protein